MEESKEQIEKYSDKEPKVVLVIHGMGQSSRDKNDRKGAMSLVKEVLRHNKDENVRNAHVVGISSDSELREKLTNKGVYHTAKSGILKFLEDNKGIENKNILIIGFSRGAYITGKMAIDPDFKNIGFAGAIMIDPPESGKVHTDNTIYSNNELDEKGRNKYLNIIKATDNILCGSISGYLDTVGMLKEGNKLNMPLNIITDLSDNTVNHNFADRIAGVVSDLASEQETRVFRPNDGGHTHIGLQKTYLINHIANEMLNNKEVNLEQNSGLEEKERSTASGYLDNLLNTFEKIRDNCGSIRCNNYETDGKYYTSPVKDSKANIPLKAGNQKLRQKYWIERANSINSDSSEHTLF